MIDKDVHSDHISQQFNVELDEVKSHLLEMGGKVEKQLTDVISALTANDSGLAEAVEVGDKHINAMEVSIDEECTRILARRQPAASDLRLVLAISKCVNDLERIGDEAGKIAKNVISVIENGASGRQQTEIRILGHHVTGMLRDALDAFARLDMHSALKVAQEDKEVDAEYSTALRALITYMMEDPRTISASINILWILRSLERIGDHSRNIAEHVIYLVKGTDVRHIGLKKMAEEVGASEK